MSEATEIAEIQRRFATGSGAASFGSEGLRPTPRMLVGRARGHRPVVIADANALISDLTRRARGLPTLMPYLAQRKLIRLVTAAHIDEKVYAGLPAACAHTRCDLQMAIDVYETEYRPLLRFVDAGGLAAEDGRISAVGLADEEDVPLVQLAVALAPSLVFTRDHHLRDAGVGADNWGDQLVLVQGLVRLDDEIWDMTDGALAAGMLAAMGVGGLAELLRRSQLALGITIGLSLAFGFQYRKRLHEIPGVFKTKAAPIATTLLEHTGDKLKSWQEAQADVEAHLIAPSAESPAAAEIASILVQRVEPIPAPGIYELLPYRRRETTSVKDVKEILWAEAAFEFKPGRGWTFGHLLRG